VSDAPQAGQTTQPGSSTILRQFWQRFGANGSTRPQNGHAATILSMSLSQYGHGCLKVGIVCSYQPGVPEGFEFVVAEPLATLPEAADSDTAPPTKSSPASGAASGSPTEPSPSSPPSPPAADTCFS
jgi:hypothetical protein